MGKYQVYHGGLNKCYYASALVADLRRHLKTDTGEKPYKCSQGNYSSVQAVGLRAHLKITPAKNFSNAIKVTLCLFLQVV